MERLTGWASAQAQGRGWNVPAGSRNSQKYGLQEYPQAWGRGALPSLSDSRNPLPLPPTPQLQVTWRVLEAGRPAWSWGCLTCRRG